MRALVVPERMTPVSSAFLESFPKEFGITQERLDSLTYSWKLWEYLISQLSFLCPPDRISIHPSVRVPTQMVPVSFSDMNGNPFSGNVSIPQVTFDTSEGGIIIEEGVRLEFGCAIKGPAIIGAHATVHRHSLVSRSYIGKRVRTGEQTCLNYCIVGDTTRFHACNFEHSLFGLSCTLGLQTVGTNTTGKTIFSAIPLRGEPIDTGFAQFGQVLGDFVRVNGRCFMNPGIKIGEHTIIHPSISLYHDELSWQKVSLDETSRQVLKRTSIH